MNPFIGSESYTRNRSESQASSLTGRFLLQTITNCVVLWALTRLLQYRTFELRIRSEFYSSNEVIVGHISLPHYREILQIFLSPGVKGIVCMKGIVKFLHMETHLMIFFLKCCQKKTLDYYLDYVFRKTVRLEFSSDIEGYFDFEKS